MKDNEDYYDLLSVDKDSTEEEIKLEYRKLPKKYHPDSSKRKIYRNKRSL